jgi:hypothetical protein
MAARNERKKKTPASHWRAGVFRSSRAILLEERSAVDVERANDLERCHVDDVG